MLKKKASAANAAYSEKEIRKQLAKNRGTRKIEKPDSAPEMEKENPLEGQTFKERIAYLRGLNGAKNKEAATEEAKDVNIEKIEGCSDLKNDTEVDRTSDSYDDGIHPVPD